MSVFRTNVHIAAALAALVGFTAAPASADQVILDDLIVDGSACIGLDCVNGESFGFDTLRLKENNLRIHFQDTSSSASFPTRDWRIVANDSSNGGAEYLAIEDTDGGRQVFRVTAGARANAIFATSNRIGFGTGNPVVELHVVDGDTPTLRLEQDGSSGFAPQTWDVAGNEAGFFIRDVTNGSKLSFRIRPNAPASSIDVAGSGNVGIGVSAPTAPLHIRRTDGTAKVFVEDTASDTGATVIMFDLEANRSPSVELTNLTNATGINWRMQNTNLGRFLINDPGDAGNEFELQSNGTLLLEGAVVQTSSRESKQDFRPVDPKEILDAVADLEIGSWSYKQSPKVRHIGPVAEDFNAAFKVGADNKGIPVLDAANIALTAVKGLNAELEAEIETLNARLAALEARLAE